MSHHLMTDLVIKKISRTTDISEYQVIIKFGSIYPDISLSHYMPRILFPNKSNHKIDDTLDLVKDLVKKIYEEVNKDKSNYEKMFFNIGKVMHYLGDFVCFPHTPIFTGNVPNHITYEKELGKELKIHSKTYLYDSILTNTHVCESADDFMKVFYRKYNRYIYEYEGYKTDIKYAMDLSSDLLYSIVRLMKKTKTKAA